MKKKKRKKITFSQIFYLVIILVFSYMLFAKRDDLGRIGQTVWFSDWNYLFFALLIQVLLMINQAFFYHECYKIFNLKVPWQRFFWVVSSGNFIGMVAPSGGSLATMAVIFNDGIKIGLSKAKIILANVSYWAIYYIVYFVFLLLALFFLIIKNQIADYMLLPALILFAFAIAVLVLAWVALDNYDDFKKWAIIVSVKFNQFNKFIGRKKEINIKSVKSYSFELYEGFSYVMSNFWKLKNIFFRAALIFLGNTLILSLLVKSYGGDWTSWGVLFSCYVIAALLMVISVTPSGAGVVELAMVTILNTFLLPFDKAVMVVILYRFLQFWVPLIWGFAVWKNLKKY